MATRTRTLANLVSPAPPGVGERSYDFVVIGGGIIGLATSLALLRRYPRAQLLLLEKESGWAYHQSGRNSGVIHSGIYYAPGSLKARLARDGNRRLIEFCTAHGIDHEICGKLIVATEERELPLLTRLRERALANGLVVSVLDADELREVEPHACGMAAIHVPSTGIVDYRRVAASLARLLAERGGDLRLSTPAEQLAERRDAITVETKGGTFQARFLINCAGLHSDRIARSLGLDARVRIVPFRGEYYELRRDRRYLVNHLIYPVPNPAFPFLGVHFTRTIEGGVHAGPNAVVSLKREGYTKTALDARDMWEVLGNPAFWKLAGRHWREGAREIFRSLSKAAFVRSLQRLVPEVRADDLVPAAAGVRAQAVAPDGRLVEDFVIVSSRRSIHVVNAPSPAATASLALGEAVAERVPEQTHLQVASESP